jgi:hypothetical protein
MKDRGLKNSLRQILSELFIKPAEIEGDWGEFLRGIPNEKSAGNAMHPTEKDLLNYRFIAILGH